MKGKKVKPTVLSSTINSSSPSSRWSILLLWLSYPRPLIQLLAHVSSPSGWWTWDQWLAHDTTGLIGTGLLQRQLKGKSTHTPVFFALQADFCVLASLDWTVILALKLKVQWKCDDFVGRRRMGSRFDWLTKGALLSKLGDSSIYIREFSVTCWWRWAGSKKKEGWCWLRSYFLWLRFAVTGKFDFG